MFMDELDNIDRGMSIDHPFARQARNKKGRGPGYKTAAEIAFQDPTFHSPHVVEQRQRTRREKRNGWNPNGPEGPIGKLKENTNDKTPR